MFNLNGPNCPGMIILYSKEEGIIAFANVMAVTIFYGVVTSNEERTMQADYRPACIAYY